MDISNFISGVTSNISNQLTPKSIPSSTVGGALIDLASLTKTNVEGLNISFNTALTTKADKSDVVSTGQTLVTNTDKSNSPVPAKGSYAINASADFVITATTGIWNIQMLNQVSNEISFKGSMNRFWFILGFKDATNLCAVGISGSGVLGRVVNVNLVPSNPTGDTFTVVKTSSLTALSTNEIGKVSIVGDNIYIFRSGVVRATLSITELLGLGANLQNIRFGIASFDPALNELPSGTTVVKAVNWTISTPLTSIVNNLSNVVASATTANNLKGKNISFLGDSITTPDYGGNTSTTIYPALIRDRYNSNIFINAISSTPIAEKSGFSSFVTDSRWQSLNSTFTPDAIVIFGGTNDFGARQVPIGTINDTGKTTFYGALKYLYGSIINANLSSKIFHMTPLHRGESGFPEINTATTLPLLQYINVIKEVAEMYGVIVIDTYNDSGLNYFNMQIGTYTLDRLHPTPLGHIKIADYVGNILNNHFKN